MYCIQGVLPTKFKPCAIKGPGQYKGTECVARDGPGERRGARMQTEVDGSGYRIAYITRLSSENEKTTTTKKKKFRLVTDQVLWLTQPPRSLPVPFPHCSLFFSVSVALVNYTR